MTPNSKERTVHEILRALLDSPRYGGSKAEFAKALKGPDRADHLPLADGKVGYKAPNGTPVDVMERRLVGNEWRYRVRIDWLNDGWCDYVWLSDVRGAGRD